MAPPPAAACPISRPRLADAVRRLLATMDCSRPEDEPDEEDEAGDSSQAVSRQPQANTAR
jgi:hypothetical protein